MANKYTVTIKYEDDSTATVVLSSDGKYSFAGPVEVKNKDSLNNLLKAIDACKDWLAENAGAQIRIVEETE